MKIKATYPALLVIFFFIFLFIELVFLNRVYRLDNEDATVLIVRGDNLRKVAVKLESKQVIFNKIVFVIAGKILSYEDKIIPGQYKFSNGLTNINVLKQLTDLYMSRGYMVTIPEGLNVRQIARLLNRQINIDSAKFVNETFNDSLIGLLGADMENLEGFLFPDTYQFSFNASGNREREIVKIMLEQFRKKFNAEMYDVMKSKKMKLKGVITMASIIEGETRHIPEMKTIAGVYYNRLRKNMRLEADPTVQFALPDGPKRRLTYRDLKFPSPYNTYLNRGLPPGPINNPGLNSMIAALDPEKHKYLYFVAKGDGTHKFAESYEEHKINVEEYRKLQGEP